MANQEQLQILKQGVDAWNKWHIENEYVYISIDLREADLHKTNLHYANLGGAYLIGANLSGANLSGAVLYKTNLHYANLQGANLNHANLEGADLSKTDLRGADLRGAYLFGANLREADLRGAVLSEARLRGANLLGAVLSEARLRGANLLGAVLRGADLRGAVLIGADLRGANLCSADLRETDLCEADLRGADLRESNLNGANLRSANLLGADVSKVNFNEVYLSKVQQRQIIENMRETIVQGEEEGLKPENTGAERKDSGSADDETPDWLRQADSEETTTSELFHEDFIGNLSPAEFSHLPNIVSSVMSDSKPVSEVSFTAYHPKEGSVESWHTLLVYTHLLSALAKVQEDAKRFDDQIKSPKETTSKSSTPIVRGTELAIIPSCEGVTFNPERVSFEWMEDFHRADFRFRADKSLSGDAAKGNIDIYVGPLIIGTLKFAMLFNEEDTQPVLEHEESVKMYGKDDVFISYSRKDTEVARTFKTVLESTGLDVFLDVDDIRSGQLWEDELKRRIERAKIFQIFWSANYNQSENCKQEWEYALQQNKDEGYIRPVYWKSPLSPKPPEELNKFNFKYVELK